MPHTSKTPSCAACGRKSSHNANAPLWRDGCPCFESGPRRCPGCGHPHPAGSCGHAENVIRWVIAEDDLGFVRSADSLTNNVTRLFAPDGTLLAERAPSVPRLKAVQTGSARHRGVERLLRYYLGQGGRRIVLIDGHGLRWQGQIVGTRWHPDGRVWFVSAATNWEAIAA